MQSFDDLAEYREFRTEINSVQDQCLQELGPVDVEEVRPGVSKVTMPDGSYFLTPTDALVMYPSDEDPRG